MIERSRREWRRRGGGCGEEDPLLRKIRGVECGEGVWGVGCFSVFSLKIAIFGAF